MSVGRSRQRQTPHGFSFAETTYYLLDDFTSFSAEDIADYNAIVGNYLKTVAKAHDNQLRQSTISFNAAILAGVVGFLFLLFSIGYIIIRQFDSLAASSLIAGAIIELFAAIQLSVFRQASERLERTQIRLEFVFRFLLAFEMADKLDPKIKDDSRSEVIKTLIQVSTTEQPAHLQVPEIQTSSVPE